jgi:hypothetical protein
MTKNSILTGENPFYKKLEEQPTPGEIANAGRPDKSAKAVGVDSKSRALSKASDSAKPKTKVSVKKAPWEQKEEVDIDGLINDYDNLLEQLDSIEEKFDELDFEDVISEEEVEEGFQGVSATKRLIAQRKAALQRRLKLGYKYKKKK